MSEPLFIAVDIGGTTIKTALADQNGNLIRTHRVRTPGDVDNAAFLEALTQSILTVQGEEKISSIGMGSPGPLDIKTGEIVRSSNMPGLNHLPIVESVQKLFPEIPVVLENDANAAALGEFFFGRASDWDNAVVITLGTGVGGGLILEKKLYRGFHSNAFEIGHIPVVTPELGLLENLPLRRCGCGALGCLETFASATGVAHYYHYFANGTLAESSQPLKANALEVAGLAQSGDKAALQAYETAAIALGSAIATTIQLMNVFQFVITGGMAAASDLLREKMIGTIHAHTFPLYHEKLEFLFTEGDENAGLLGALAVALATVE